jgi:hypothetical protein
MAIAGYLRIQVMASVDAPPDGAATSCGRTHRGWRFFGVRSSIFAPLPSISRIQFPAIYVGLESTVSAGFAFGSQLRLVIFSRERLEYSAQGRHCGVGGRRDSTAVILETPISVKWRPPGSRTVILSRVGGSNSEPRPKSQAWRPTWGGESNPRQKSVCSLQTEGISPNDKTTPAQKRSLLPLTVSGGWNIDDPELFVVRTCK